MRGTPRRPPHGCPVAAADRDLARVVAAWPILPAPIKAAVLALLAAAPPGPAPDARPGGAVE